MSEQYPGGFITKSPVAPTLTAASGIWTMDQYLQYWNAGTWPGAPQYDPYFQNVALLLHMDGTNGGTTFTDNSNYALVSTPTNATTSTTQIKFGTASASFPGNGYLIVPTTTQLTFGTSDFTIEFWVYSNATQTKMIYDCRPSSTDGLYPTIYLSSSAITFYTNSADRITGATLTSNTWYHIALCRASGVTTLYVNGTKSGSSYVDTNNYLLGASRPVIGNSGYNLAAGLNGYIDDFRITTGIARYTGNFTVPTTACPNAGFSTYASYDPFFFSTSLLLHMDGSNGGTTFTDSSLNGLTVTPTNATTSTTQVKYGTASMSIGGNGYLSVPSASNFAFGTGDFTIECWVYPNGSNQTTFIYDCRPTSTEGLYPSIYLNSGNITFYTNSADRITGSALSANNWYHIAVSRSNGSTRLFVNGTQSGSTYADTNNYILGASRPFIGISGYSTTTGFNGYIDDFRITSGVARYTGTFTPPTAAFLNAGPPFAAWSTTDKNAGVALSNQTLTATETAAVGNIGLRGTMGKSAGKWYWEYSGQNSTYVLAGIATATASLTSTAPTGTAIYYDSNGNRLVNGSNIGAVDSWRDSTSIIGVSIDADAGTMGLYKNNVFQGQFSYVIANPVYPCAIFPNDAGDTITGNFGQLPLKYTPPNGTFWDKTISGSSVAFSNNNMTATWAGALSADVTKASGKGASTGKWYFEFTIQVANQIVGIANANAETANWLGYDAYGWGYWGNNGHLTHNGSTATVYGNTFTTGDVIGVAVDMTNGKVYFAKNGTWQNSSDPVTATNPAFTGITGTVYPAAGNGGLTGYITLNTGASTFKYSVPSGYTAWDTTVYSPGVY